MARPKSANPRTEVKIRLLPEHLAMLDILTRDPDTLEVKYSERAKHIDAALTEYFSIHYPGLRERIDNL